ncbi:Aspartate/glutamate/uridylate kinase [Powellomyces hirtus]|nr:Aspartate/glutamate/uridylate kinase [Powellomyces hirtus]
MFTNNMSQQRPASSSTPHKTTVVIKLGTSSICDEETFDPKLASLSLLVETIIKLRKENYHVIIVSSGAVGTGLRSVGLRKRPKSLGEKQAVAAVGQGRLMALYYQLFGYFGVGIAQVLLTRDCLAERAHYLNARNTFRHLLRLNVVPIVNENDTVNSSELRFGDNDTLSAITAGMVDADYLFLLTDVECLYTDNPRTNPAAEPVRLVTDVAELRTRVNVDSPGSGIGTGGMVTKLVAADLASAAGCRTIITLGSAPEKIPNILAELAEHRRIAKSSPSTPPVAYEPTMGTHFLPRENALLDRKWWILHGLGVSGTIYLDAGAVHAVTRRERSSLFAVGVARVSGYFNAQQSVRLVTLVKTPDDTEEREVEVGKGLVNYSSAEIARIKGHKSGEIEALLGYIDSGCVMHRDSIVVTATGIDISTITLKGAGRNKNPTRSDDEKDPEIPTEIVN